MTHRVLVTGGAGFLGRAILRQVKRGDLDWDVTVYSRDEAIQEACRKKYPDFRYILGDVRDFYRLCAAMADYEWVVHAAALKYIPEAEMNATECISVNVDGSRNVLAAARQNGVERVVGVSTDKAVQPVNIYGMTKAVMERLFSEQQQHYQAPACVCVRYGNVIGSTGSVLPIFRQQEKDLGKVRITDPLMTRFWMGVDEAIEIIETALTPPDAHDELLLGIPGVASGSIVIPPVRAMTLLDSAKAATREDIEVEVIGTRPGEKQHESLLHEQESVRTEAHDDLFLELLPPGTPAQAAPFTISSDSPQHLMSPVEMRELIADAEEV